MYNLANASIYFYSIQRGTPHVNLRQKRASLFNSQILVVALIGIFGGLKPKMCVHFSKDWRSVVIDPDTQYLDGILLPLYDTTLEAYCTAPHSALNLQDLCSIIETVKRLHSFGIVHGDICERNIVISTNCSDQSRSVVLIDFGDVAPFYEGDVKAAG